MEAEGFTAIGTAVGAAMTTVVVVLAKLRKNGKPAPPKPTTEPQEVIEPPPTKSEFAELRTDVKHLDRTLGETRTDMKSGFEALNRRLDMLMSKGDDG